jgi:hypothetical protein
MLKAGAVATANIISSRFSSEGKLDRGRCGGVIVVRKWKIMRRMMVQVTISA